MQDNLPPVFLLDVDGVINVDRPAWPDADARATVTTSDGVTWPFRWSPALVIELGRLHAGGLVEIRWCTTWCHESHLLENLWRLPRFASCWAHDIPRHAVPAAKLAHARAVLGSGRRLIWADDEAIPRSKERRLLGMTGDALYLTPFPATGLSPAHLRQITTFAAAAASTASPI